jgi:hypothetical protein
VFTTVSVLSARASPQSLLHKTHRLGAYFAAEGSHGRSPLDVSSGLRLHSAGAQLTKWHCLATSFCQL